MLIKVTREKWHGGLFGFEQIRHCLTEHIQILHICLSENIKVFQWLSNSTFFNFMMMMMMMMMMNRFCDVVDRQKVFGFISSRNHWRRSSTSRISNKPRAGFDPAQNRSSDFAEWGFALVITATQCCHTYD